MEAKLELLPDVDGSIVSAQGQLLLPCYKLLPYEKFDKSKPPHELMSAQHLVNGGLFRWGGDLQWLEDDNNVIAETTNVQLIVFDESFMRNEKYFKKIRPSLTKEI